MVAKGVKRARAKEREKGGGEGGRDSAGKPRESRARSEERGSRGEGKQITNGKGTKKSLAAVARI